MSEPDPSPSLPPSPPLRARGLGWLRFLIWILPSVVLPMCIFGAAQLRGLPYSMYLGGALALGLTIYLGHFNALLRCQHLGIPHDHPRAAIRTNVWNFVMLQFVVIPAVWLTVAWGFCAITSIF